MMSEMGLCPTAPPTAWADRRAVPCFAASRAASAPYVVVCPYGICSSSAHTSCRKSDPMGCSGGIKSGIFPLKYTSSQRFASVKGGVSRSVLCGARPAA